MADNDIEWLVLENAAFSDIAKKANTVAASRGEAYERAGGIVLEHLDNGSVIIRATNLDLFYTEWLNQKEVSASPFSWRLASRLLIAITGVLPTGSSKTVRLSVNPGKPNRVSVVSGSFRASLPLMDADGFPEWGVFDPDGLVEVQGFSRAVEMVEWACEENASPALLRGVHFTGTEVYGTNKLWAARATLEFPATEPFTIPAGTIAQIVKTTGGGDAKVSYDGDKLHLMPNAHTQMQVLSYGGEYPAITKLWITQPTHTFEINREKILEILNRCVVMANTDRQPGIFILLGNGKFGAFATTESDGASSGDTTTVPGHLDHPMVKFYFSPAKLLKALEAAPGFDVTIQYSPANPESKWIISSGDVYSAIISPRRQTSPVESDQE